MNQKPFPEIDEFLPKKLLVICDMTGYGRCSMTVALPVISACGVQACPVPTAIFSNHTAYPTHFSVDLTDYMEDYLRHLDMLNLDFDGIYCGYLNSVKQMDIVGNHISKNFSKKLVVIDPVMADNGKPYQMVSPEFCNRMKDFVQYADILTPNITEACLLTDTPYEDHNWQTDELLAICQKLDQSKKQKIVITGIQAEQLLVNFIYESPIIYSSLFSPIVGDLRHGCGDLFASILSALTVRGYSLAESVAAASSFIAKCTQAAIDSDIPELEGVLIEECLTELMLI